MPTNPCKILCRLGVQGPLTDRIGGLSRPYVLDHPLNQSIRILCGTQPQKLFCRSIIPFARAHVQKRTDSGSEYAIVSDIRQTQLRLTNYARREA